MEFLRFGSSIPGSYWGCCCADIIQNFHVDPDAKASIEIVDGDGNNTLGVFAGKTYLEIFKARLRFGTFSTNDMPNHAFLAIMTESQLNGTYGKKWLSILKDHGFEFIRAIQNSVYSGESLGEPVNKPTYHTNYLFALFRNIGAQALADPFTPPKAWTDLPEGKTEPIPCVLNNEFSIEGMTFNDLAKDQHAFDTAVWNNVGPTKLYTEAELEKEGIPIWYAGVRNKYPQELKDSRLSKKALEGLNSKPSNSIGKISDPFGTEVSQVAAA